MAGRRRMPRERIAKHLSERAPTDDGFHGNRPRYQQPCELRQPHSPHIALRKRFQVATKGYVTIFGTKKTFYAEQIFVTTRSDNDTVSSGQVAKNTAQRQENQLFIKILPPEISGLKPSTIIR